jgi:hypothetical protein
MLSRTNATAQGFPDLALIVVPHPFGTLTESAVRAHADAIFPDIIRALVKQ